MVFAKGERIIIAAQRLLNCSLFSILYSLFMVFACGEGI